MITIKAIRLVSGTVAAAALASALMAAPAEARDRRGISPGAAVGIGILGVAAGAAIAGAASTPTYAAPAPRYVAPAPVYVEPEPVYVAPRPRVVVEENCRVERTREWVSGYGWQTMRRTVCY